MKNIQLLLSFLFILLVSTTTLAQVTVNPTNFDQDTPVTIRFDAALADPDGSAGLVGESKVYMHSGAMMGGPRSEDWSYVVGNWGADDGLGEMTNVGGDIWEITITPSSYYGIGGGELIYRLGMVFRSANGNNVGKNQDGSGNIYIRTFGAVQDRAVDSVSLVDLYNDTNGSSWTNGTNWNITSMDTWNGITVTSGRVTDVVLSNNNLVGALPSAIGDMDALVNLDLSLNTLSGDVPETMVNMSNLSELYIDDNQLTNLPDFSPNTSLTLLGVANNYFDFGDLEPNIGQPYSISYISQFDYGSDRLRGLFDGQTITLSTDPGGTANSYQWFKDGVIVSGATNQTLDVLGDDIVGEAIYHCEVTNSNVSGLTLTSAPIIVRKSFPTLETDSLALVALYNVTDGANWNNNENWLTGPVDVWEGVTANTGRVDSLWLGGNNLTGELPNEIGNLTNISQLALHNNSIGGLIPPEIGNLTQLKALYLLGNNFEGSLPVELGNCILMEDFEVHSNNLSGTIPTEYSSWTKLRIFAVGDNSLAGSVPASFAGFSSLVELYIPNNYFDDLPDFSGLTSWEYFEVQNNNFTFEDLEPNAGITATVTLALFPQNQINLGGTQIINIGDSLNFDATIGGSANIYDWYKDGVTTGVTTSNFNIISVSLVDQGDYQGKIVSSFFPGDTIFTELTAVFVAADNREADSLVLVDMYNTMGGTNWNNQNNWLSGTLDTWNGIILNGGRVYEINLNGNNLSGSFPPNIGKLDAIERMELGDNSISDIPPEFYTLTSLNFLFLFNNALSGDLPTEFGNLVNLRQFFINGNSLTGTIPSSYQNLIILEGLGLTTNQLTGAFPTWLAGITTLTSIYLDENQLSGVVPDLTGLDNLKHFKINSNNFSGDFPEANWLLPSLEVINLGFNPDLKITLPSGLGSLINLTELNISGTLPIRGAFPTEVFNLTNLVDLNLGGHFFTGTIGSEIGNLVNIEWLWIWDNLLTGDFPTELTNLSNLRGVGIAGNQFTSFPDISGLPNLSEVDIAWNYLDFDDLAPYSSLSLSNFRYSPQDRMDAQYFTVAEQGALTIDNPYDASGNNYLWVFNLDTLSSETNRNLSISNAALSNLGGYYCVITNSILPDLYINSPFFNVAFSGDPKAFYVDNRPGALADFDSFYAGFYGTNDGDTLYVAGSEIPYNIGGLRLETPRVIIGPGYFLDSNSKTQHNKQSAIIEQYLHIAPGAEGSIIYGLDLQGYRVDFHNVASTSPSTLSDVKLIGNKIQQLNFSHTASNIELAGNYINLLYFNSTSLNRTLWRTYDDFNIHNNIIDSVGTIFARISTDHNSLTNFDFVNNTINYISDSIQNVFLKSNIIGTNASIGSTKQKNLIGDYSTGVFKNGSGTFTLDGDFILSSSSAAIGAGAGGDDAGHSGGTVPYVLSGLPPVPNTFDIQPLSRLWFDVSAKQNENTSTTIKEVNYWISNNGDEVDKGHLLLDRLGRNITKTFRPKLSKVDPGAIYDLYVQAKASDGSKGLKQLINFEATTVNASGNITTSEGANVSDGKVYLFEINAEKTAFDTLTTVVSKGAFNFGNIVEGDYLSLAVADTTKYPNQLPTYYKRTNFWEESDTLLVDQSFPDFSIRLVKEPAPSSGDGKIYGVLEEEFDDTDGGRVEGKKRVGGAGVSVRRRNRQSRGEEDEYKLVSYVYTNENGEFSFNKLDDDEYLINIQYPGYPMDEKSSVFITLGEGGGDYAEVSALVADGKIAITVVEITGMLESKNIAISIFPNPSSNKINILKKDSGFINGKAELIDLKGRTVRNMSLNSPSNTMNIQEIPNGVYILKLYEKGEIINVSRVVKSQKKL